MAAEKVLSAADQAAIHAAIQRTEYGKQLCAKGALCGFDFTGQQAMLHETQQRLRAIQLHFGSGANTQA